MITVKEMIAYLERLPEDTEVVLSVRDHYTTYGQTAHFHDFSMEGGIWNHPTRDNQLTIVASLDTQRPMTSNEVEKYPKITFRKR